MKQSRYLEEMESRYPALQPIRDKINAAAQAMIECYKNGGKVLVCGNGGSAADCEHIVGELMKSFVAHRPVPEQVYEKIADKFPEDVEYLTKNMQVGLPAISLVSQTSIMTAFMNDVAPEMVFAQQVYGYGNKGDILIAISTSGNSTNIINAVKVASSLGLKCIAMTNSDGGKLADMTDILLNVPEGETYKVQEYHLPIYHTICLMVEDAFFGGK